MIEASPSQPNSWYPYSTDVVHDIGNDSIIRRMLEQRQDTIRQYAESLRFSGSGDDNKKELEEKGDITLSEQHPTPETEPQEPVYTEASFSLRKVAERIKAHREIQARRKPLAEEKEE